VSGATQDEMRTPPIAQFSTTTTKTKPQWHPRQINVKHSYRFLARRIA
jgi:hypothetical protein